MNNLLNFKQKIVKRNKKPDYGNVLIWNSKPVNGKVSSAHKRKSKIFRLQLKERKTVLFCLNP